MDAPVRKLDALTGLRFFAAALIVVHHSRGMLCLPAPSDPPVLINRADYPIHQP